LLGSTADTAATDTVFGRIAELSAYVDDLETNLGATTDSGSSTLWGEINALQTATDNVDGTAASILEEVQALTQTLGGATAADSVTEGLEDIKGLLGELKKATRSIMDQGAETQEVAQDMVNKLIEATNKSLEEMGFIGSQIKKLDEEQSQNRGFVMAKLEEIKTYLLSIKEATDTMDKKPGGANYAVVQAWMEMETG